MNLNSKKVKHNLNDLLFSLKSNITSQEIITLTIHNITYPNEQDS